MSITAVLAGACLVAVLAAVAFEWLLRRFGFIDFPLYEIDPVCGYAPRANQQGRLRDGLGKPADWAFNELALGVAEPFQPKPGSILLLGDSIVHSGARTPQARKLGPLLQARLGRPVWPMGVRNWAFANEIAWLKAHPEVLACEMMVVVLNSGDFFDAETWSDPLLHPLHKPRSATLYVAWKRWKFYTRPRPKVEKPPERPFPSPEQEARWIANLDWLLGVYKGRLIFVLYPDKPETLHGEDRFVRFKEALAGRAETFEVRPHWSTANYVDWMHPRADAYPALADLIVTAVEGQRRAA